MLNRILQLANSFAALLLALACITPYTPPTRLPLFFSFLSLGVPLLVVANLFFFIYWLAVHRRYAWLSFGILFVSYIFLGSFYEFRFAERPMKEEHLKVMTFNAHTFNNHHIHVPGKNVDQKIHRFLAEQDPDILSFQEYDPEQTPRLSQFPHHFVHDVPGKVVQAIFSKYPIVHTGSLDFPGTSNNAIFADIQYQGDTIRLYNTHLQSFQVMLTSDLLKPDQSGKAYDKFLKAFPMQHQQAALLVAHRNNAPHPVLVSGDMNNTQFSNVYRSIKGELVDSFDEAGTGYGRTYHFKYYPLRIDFLLAEESYFQVEAHKNYNQRISDHFPIMAAFSIREP